MGSPAPPRLLERALYKVAFHGLREGSWASLMTLAEVGWPDSLTLQARHVVTCLRTHDSCVEEELMRKAANAGAR